jgi:hypothetical protein
MKRTLLAFVLLVTSSLSFGEDMMKTTQLDDLVRDELAAIKAYDAALADLKAGPEKTRLQAIRKDHDRAAAILSKYVRGNKELLEDTKSAGPWGTFATTWTKGAGLMGNRTAMKALRQGEEHGIDTSHFHGTWRRKGIS